ncbi:MAG: YihA family ribosome biogenesis GTP-binding protein [Clostridiales bacterium]|nr:YihA family ribosome biogenesis GTP-binding protein [Clostridiales bacterium]
MKIKSAKFIKSCSDPKAAAEYSPQICVAGRSNCGKSTLLNMLMGAKLCKTSSTPGRTRLVNIFEVTTDSNPFYLVDLPGYGYSKAAKYEADEWNARTEGYFSSGNNIAQTLCLMDIRRDPSDLDKVLINFLRDMGLPFTVVLTKADKLSRAQAGNVKISIAAALGLARDNLIVTSGNSGQGKDKLVERLGEILSVSDEED